MMPGCSGAAARLWPRGIAIPLPGTRVYDFVTRRPGASPLTS